MAIQRNLDGYSALPNSDPLAQLDLGNPRKWAVLMDDFLAYDITQLVGGNPYTFTATNCVDTIVGPTGVLALTLGGADNDVGELQITGTPIATNGKKLFFECRFNLTLASAAVMTAGELAIGLFSQQTTTSFMAADGLSLTADQALGLVKFDAQASCNLVMRQADVQSVLTNAITLTSGTWITLSIYYDGTKAHFYQDQAKIGELETVDTTSVVTPTLFVKAGEAKANVLNVDYFLVACER